MNPLELPRYKDNEILLFFEDYVLEIIEKLPEERNSFNQGLNLKEAFQTEAEDWLDVIEETLELSDTFDVAVCDAWIRDCKGYDDNEAGAIAFAQDFVDDYLEDDSVIDIWASEELFNEAQKRVNAYYQAKHIKPAK